MSKIGIADRNQLIQVVVIVAARRLIGIKCIYSYYSLELHY